MINLISYYIGKENFETEVGYKIWGTSIKYYAHLQKYESIMNFLWCKDHNR